MKHSEWLEVGARVGELWPGKAWPLETMAAAYDQFSTVPLAATIKAVDQLMAEGREFSPAPGVVLSKALQVVIAETPALPDVDASRPLTAEEQERARRMAAALNGDKGRLVQATWMEFARHARNCRSCGIVADRCRRSGQDSRQVNPWIDEVCLDGRPSWNAWRESVFEFNGAVPIQEEARL